MAVSGSREWFRVAWGCSVTGPGMTQLDSDGGGLVVGGVWPAADVGEGERLNEE